MTDIINFITNGNNEWTPEVVIGLMVFAIIFESMFMLVGQIVRVFRK